MARNLRPQQTTDKLPLPTMTMRDSVIRGPSRSVQPKEEVLDYAMLADFTKKEVGEIREAFDLFDKQGKGIVNIKQMIKYLEDLKVDESYPTVFKLMLRLDEEFPRGASFKEFMEHAQFFFGDIETGPGLTRLFELIDYGKNDYVSIQDFERVAREIGENISRDEIIEIVEDFYECPDHKVDVDSFYQMMSKRTF